MQRRYICMKIMALTLLTMLALTPAAPAAETPPLPRPYPETDVIPEPEPVLPRSEASRTVPDRIYRTACPAVLQGRVIAEAVPVIRDEACGLRSPYAVTGVTIGARAVQFSQTAIVNCQMAGELARWLERVDAYTAAMFNAGLAEVKTGTSYMCRGRNRVADADISEHGFGNALDVTGFMLTDGTEIGLPDDWTGKSPAARTMHLAHDAACGHFTTVLGPEANALHADHLHLDLGCHGESCTYRLCE